MWNRATKLFVIVAAAAVAGCEEQPLPQQQATPYAHPYHLNEQQTVSFNRAVELISQLRYESAAGELAGLIPTFERLGATHHAAEATFWLGYCREKLGRLDEAKILYSQCVQKYPRTAAAQQASRRLDRFQYQ